MRKINKILTKRLRVSARKSGVAIVKMKRSLFEIHPVKGQWWKGSIVINYNLALVAKLLVVIAILAAILFVGYWLVMAGWAALCWLASQWMWIIGLLAILFILWLLSAINWKKVNMPKWHISPNIQKWIWRVLAAILLILFLLWGWKSCDYGNDDIVVIEQPATTVTNERFDEAFDYVVTSRAYLDGVQEKGDKINRALVGLKYVNGKSVTPQDFHGQTYEEAVKVISADWRELVVGSLNGQKLSDQQLVTITLFAMRNGKYGYQESDFLKAVQQGNWDSSKMAIHKADGTKRTLGVEARQYLWVLKNLADNNLTIKELLDFPMFSYKSIPVVEMYDKNVHKFNNELRSKLLNGDQKTPRQALEL